MLKLKERNYFFIILLSFLFFLFPTEELTPYQQEAKLFRNRGLQFQRQGRLDEAMVCYQKAITSDPNFVVAYNDLGIVYEAKGWLDKAEEIYLAGLEIDSNYLNLYSNLAMLCEQRGDYQRAAVFWKKRVDLGSSAETWMQIAKERLEALREAMPQLSQEYLQEETEELAREVSMNKRVKRLNDLAEAHRLFEEAKRLYKNAEYEKALSNINLALGLDPENKQELLRLKNEINAKLIQ